MPNVGAARGIWLVGREGELAALRHQLRSLMAGDEAGIVTITGLPGAGKATLAAHVAAELLAEGTAVVVAPLIAAEDPLAVTDAVLARLPGPVGLNTSLPEALWESFGGAPVLLVLEDVDRVEGLADLVAELQSAYSSVTVLVTTLRPTRAHGERVVRLPPMPLPADDAQAEHPTVALFASLAAAHGAELDLDDDEVRRDVARLCRATGGLPGIVELAAARSVSLPPKVMVRALVGRHGLATVQPGDDSRHDSLEATLSWSFDLLTKAAQRTLEQIAVFETPFLLDAAAAVVDLDHGDPADALLELVDAHLVELDPSGSGEPRFEVPGLVRGFARYRLQGTGSADEVRDRHATYFRNRSRAGIDAVRREWADLVAALDHETHRGNLDDALSVAVALAPAVQELPGATADVQDRMAELLGQGRPVPDKLRARALVWSSTAYPDGMAEDLHRLGVWTGERVAEATTLARESGDGPALLESLELTITTLRVTLDMPAALAAAHEGLALAQRLDDQRAIARFESWVGMAVRLGGDSTESARLAASAVARGREHDDPVAIIQGSHLLLDAPVELRPVLDPPLLDREALLAECERAGQPFPAMTVLAGLARDDLASGDLPRAARWLWRLLMLAANRNRTEPMATLGGVATLVSVALAMGTEDDAVRLRESVRSLEPFIPYCLPPAAALAYQEDLARLTAAVPEDRYQALAAEVAGISVEASNRRAQEVARRLSGHRPPAPTAAPVSVPAEPLTPRENQVLASLASGRTNREIAEDLGMSAKTVMHHSVAIYRKLGVRGRTGATAWAVQQGMG